MDNERRRSIYLRDRSELTPAQARRVRKHHRDEGAGAEVRAERHENRLARWRSRVKLRKEMKRAKRQETQ